MCHEPKSIIELIRQHDPSGDGRTFEEHKKAANLCWRHLGLVDGDCTRVHAVANARHNAADDQLSEREGCCLDRGSDKHDGCADDNRSATAEFVAKRNDPAGADEAADFVDRNDERLDRARLVLGIHRWELVEKDGLGQDAAHDGLCIVLA